VVWLRRIRPRSIGVMRINHLNESALHTSVDASQTPHAAGLCRLVDRSRVLLPGSDGFAAATSLWNGAVVRRPAVVVQIASAREAQSVLTYARGHGLAVSVRGGGHDWAGRSLVDGGVVIDLSQLRQVTVDPVAGIANFGGGATAADVVAATEPHSLLPVTGTYGQVGMTGLTLGGGYGPLNGFAGLALDNLLGAQVVLPDGRLAVVDAHREPDLFWALRGGGGNFGVVTSMRVALHRIPEVVGGIILFPWWQARQVLSGFAELLPTLPDQLTVQTGVLAGPEGDSVVYLSPTWAGQGDPWRWIDRLASLGQPLLNQVSPMPYSTMLSLLDPYIVWGRHHEVRTRTLPSLTTGAIEAIIRAGDDRTSAFSGVVVHHFHGAATRIPLEDSAFGIRQPHAMVEIVAAWDPSDDPAPHRRWAASVFTDLAADALEGGYPNMIGPGQAVQAQQAYGPNAARLLQVKQDYDPTTVFTATTLPVRGPRMTRPGV
jgi:FAD/FMN-containing dehydrogenase